MMKSILKKAVIAAIVLPLTFTSVYAKPGRMGHHNGMPLKGMLKQIDLTAEQKVEIDTILQTHRAEMPTRQDRGVFHEQQMTILKADQFSEAQASELIAAKQALRKDKQLKKMKVMHEVYHALTPEQQAKMDELFSQRQERKGKKGKGWRNNQ